MRRLRTQRSCPSLVVAADSFHGGPLRDGVDPDLAMRRLSFLSFQRRCPSVVDTTALFQGGRCRPLRDGSDAEVAQVSARVVDSSSLEFTRRLSPHGHSITHAAFDDATFASHFTHAVHNVGFWCWWSDHEFVLVETRSSWLWGTKTTPNKVGRPASDHWSSREDRFSEAGVKESAC